MSGMHFIEQLSKKFLADFLRIYAVLPLTLAAAHPRCVLLHRLQRIIKIFCNRSQGINDEERQYQGVALGRNS
jgi:hypothetical protein